MSFRGRIKTVERQLGIGEDVWTTIIVDGLRDGIARERAEEAKRRGWRMHIVRIGVQDTAETIEEAERIIEKHRAANAMIPISVYEKGTQCEKVLVEWDPGLPDWLQDDTQSGEV